MILPERSIGDLTVSAVGLGCMPMSFTDMVDERERALAAIHCALDLGITLLDTSDIYAPSWDTVGHNELLIAEALRAYRGPADLDRVVVTTKGGIVRGPGETWGRDSSAVALRGACEASLTRLGVDVFDLYQHHRHDPELTYEQQMRSLAALREAGLVRRLGLSNVRRAELELALEILGGPTDGGVVSVQNEFSPRFRGDADVLELCADLGIAFLPWSPLGGATQAREVGSHYGEFATVGAQIGATPQETVLAWLLDLSPVIIPIPGATRPTTVESIVRSAAIRLSPGQAERLTATVPSAESMYPEDQPRSPLR